MKFLVDECVAQPIARALSEFSSELAWIGDLAPRERDVDILARALATKAIIVTEDNDFGELAFSLEKPAYGIVLIRMSRFSGKVADNAAEIARRIDELGETLVGRFTTIAPTGTRQRLLPPSRSGQEQKD